MAKSSTKSEVATKAKAEVANIQVPQVLVEKFEKLGVSQEEASALLTNFGVPLTEVGPIIQDYQRNEDGEMILGENAIRVTSVEDTEQQAKARETRLKLKKIRTGVENTRKSLKEEYNRKGNAIQAVANYIREEIEPVEQYLQLQEDFIKVQEEKAEAERIIARTEKLTELGADPSIYSLGDMSEDAFESLIIGLKDANDARIAREKAEAEEEAKLAAEKAAEDKRIRDENERLKKEADERDRVAAEAKAKADAELAAEKAKSDALAKAAAEKEAKEAAERAAAAKAEQDAKDAAEAAKKAAELAPDKDKIVSFTNGLQIVVDTRLPEVQSPEAKSLVEQMKTGLESYIKRVQEAAAKL